MESQRRSDLRIVEPNQPWWKYEWKELWDFRFLLYFFLKRDLILQYKQTILGPLHLILRPLILTIVFQIIFNRMGGISTDGVSPFLFYFANTVLWTLFSGVFGSVSNVFTSGKALMIRVYFPRMIPPFSTVLTNGVTFIIQFVFLLALSGVLFWMSGVMSIKPMFLLVVIPFIQVSMIAIGFGFLFAIITLKYRDLRTLSTVITQGLMFLSPVVYPLAEVSEKYRLLASLNPLSSAMELYRHFLFNKATLSYDLLAYGWGITIVVFLVGIFSFNVAQRKFVDIV